MDTVSTAKSTEGADDVTASALGDLTAHLVFWFVAVGLLALDLYSKHWVFSTLSSTEVRPVVSGVLDFRCSLNDGAVFGSFTGQTSLFIVASVFALCFVFYLFAQSTRHQRGLHIALAMILAGAFGNLYDRAYVEADVVRYAAENGRTASVIGKIVSEPGSPIVRVGDWPDGHHPHTFNRDEVTIRRQGVVRDFIKFVPRFPSWTPRLGGMEIWPWVFNIADAALVCGVGILLIHTWWDRKPAVAAI